MKIDKQCKTCAHRTGVTCAFKGDVFADNYCGCHERKPPSPAERKRATFRALIRARVLASILADATYEERPKKKARLFARAAQCLDKIHDILRIADAGAS
jgi:hypothetical protein